LNLDEKSDETNDEEIQDNQIQDNNTNQEEVDISPTPSSDDDQITPSPSLVTN